MAASSSSLRRARRAAAPTSLAHLDNLKERIGTPRLVICLDSGGLSYDRLWLTTSLRGNLIATVTGRRADRGHPQRPGRRRRPVVVPHPAPHPVADRGRGDRPHPLARAPGAGIPGGAPGQPRGGGGRVPRQQAPVVDGLQLLAPDPFDRLVARTWGAALEVTGADGLPKPHDGGNVLRPSTTLKFSLRLPPDVDAQAATDALVSAIRTDEGAHITIDLEAAAQGWVAPPLAAGVAATLSAVSKERFGHESGFVGEGGSIPFLADLQKGFPGTAVRRHRRARARTRTRTVPTSRSTSPWPRPSPTLVAELLKERRTVVAAPVRGAGRPAGGQGRARHRRQPWARPGHGARLRRRGRRRGDRQPQARRLPGRWRPRWRPRGGGRCPWPATSGTGTRSTGWSRQAYDTFGRVDVLVNNAGMSPLYPDLTAVSEELWDKVLGRQPEGPVPPDRPGRHEDGGRAGWWLDHQRLEHGLASGRARHAALRRGQGRASTR